MVLALQRSITTVISPRTIGQRGSAEAEHAHLRWSFFFVGVVSTIPV